MVFLCGFTFTASSMEDITQTDWVNLKPIKEVIVTPQVDLEQNGVKEELDKINQLILKKNELLSQGVEDWAKTNGIDFIWNSPKDIVIFNEIKIEGKDRIQILEKLGKQLSLQKAGFYLKFYEKK